MTSTPEISVVIPTHNRWEALQETLTSLAGQSLSADRFEVVVVDDGSTDGGGESITALKLPYRLGFFRQGNRGAAAARNLGAGHAAAGVLLFLDTDMIAEPQLLAEHLASHDRYGQVLVVGRRQPWPEARVSALARLVDLDSNVPQPEGGEAPVSFEHAFTANLSLKRAHLSQIGGFDEQFPRSGYEDVEFAYRAVRRGFEIVYSPRAVAYHNHPLTFEQICRQTRAYKASAVLLLNKHPELRGQIATLRDKEPMSLRRDPPRLLLRKAGRRVLAWRPVLAALHSLAALFESWWPSPRILRCLYDKILGSYRLIGFREGIKKYGW